MLVVIDDFKKLRPPKENLKLKCQEKAQQRLRIAVQNMELKVFSLLDRG